MLLLGMVFATSGSANPTTARLPIPVLLDSLPVRLAASARECSTQRVRVTLDSEQISFCAPTSQSFNVVQDNLSDAYISYAGLNQMDGYGIVNIKATTPGYAPGPGRPEYTSGQMAEYRQKVWDIESSKTDRVVSSGPEGLFWNETVPSMQVDFSLPALSGYMQLRSIEWLIEHNGLIWSFILTWDTEMKNATEWERASRIFSVDHTDDENLTDTAIDLGSAFLESKATRDDASAGGPVEVGLPAWWSGVCNDDNFFKDMGVHSFMVGTAWHGVYACGPQYSMHLVRFFPGAYGEFEFQCVELVMRFLYLEWGIAPWAGNANTIKDAPPSSVVFYPNGTPAMVPGDILTEQGTTANSTGHSMIITGVYLDNNGTGTISILEQNSSSGGSRSLSVTNWTVNPDAWTWGSPVQGWLHARANQPAGDLKLFLPLVAA